MKLLFVIGVLVQMIKEKASHRNIEMYRVYTSFGCDCCILLHDSMIMKGNHTFKGSPIPTILCQVLDVHNDIVSLNSNESIYRKIFHVEAKITH